ncbi:MAG: hypothetical protein PHR35_07355 [Kiritimatiellae bacterium]|nr:hypothetical protein [Kiritimatiellia bacterium]
MNTPVHVDRMQLIMRPLAERGNRVHFPDDAVMPDTPAKCAPEGQAFIGEAVKRIRAARAANRPVVLAFGAHTIKNGLGPVMNALMREGWLTHLATNGAGIIHDWELAYQGATSEDVRANVAEGQFGLWQETGLYLNLALLVGAWSGRGYGASVGVLVAEQGLDLPTEKRLMADADAVHQKDLDRAAAALDLMAAMRRHHLAAGRLDVPHRFGSFGVQAEAYRRGIPFTGHPMIGHDIIYAHPMNSGAAVGRTAERDFLAYATAIRGLQGGVYLSIGSAVMSPMIFEKSLSMARNLARQAGETIDDFFLGVVDLAPATWDWQAQGEPPPDNAAYYQRYAKSFSRMGGTLRYASMDNRDCLLGLLHELRAGSAGGSRKQPLG